MLKTLLQNLSDEALVVLASEISVKNEESKEKVNAINNEKYIETRVYDRVLIRRESLALQEIVILVEAEYESRR